MFGLTLEPQFTKVTWEWKDPHVVGESMSFFLKVISDDDAPMVCDFAFHCYLTAGNKLFGFRWLNV